MMKKLLGIVVLGLLWCNVSYSADDLYLKCTPADDQQSKIAASVEYMHLRYIKLNPVEKVEFGWSSKEKTFERYTTYYAKEVYYYLRKNLKQGLVFDILIYRETGFLQSSEYYINVFQSNKPYLICSKIESSDLPREQVKQLF